MAQPPFSPLPASSLPVSVTYNGDGLVPVVVQRAGGDEVLMLAWMNEEALKLTLATGRMTYWSRSRKALWRKGETSGNTQKLIEMRLDCDGDTLLAQVEQTGPACHTGESNCFFRAVSKEG